MIFLKMRSGSGFETTKKKQSREEIRETPFSGSGRPLESFNYRDPWFQYRIGIRALHIVPRGHGGGSVVMPTRRGWSADSPSVFPTNEDDPCVTQIDSKIIEISSIIGS